MYWVSKIQGNVKQKITTLMLQEVYGKIEKKVYFQFENQTKHLNYLYASSINFVHEFFKLDNYFNNYYSNKLFNFLENNTLFKKYSTKFADKGFIE